MVKNPDMEEFGCYCEQCARDRRDGEGFFAVADGDYCGGEEEKEEEGGDEDGDGDGDDDDEEECEFI